MRGIDLRKLLRVKNAASWYVIKFWQFVLLLLLLRLPRLRLLREGQLVGRSSNFTLEANMRFDSIGLKALEGPEGATSGRNLLHLGTIQDLGPRRTAMFSSPSGDTSYFTQRQT